VQGEVVEIAHADMDTAARRIERVAVRAVALRGDEVLLLRGAAGDYRFPGGGVDPGETLEESLRRELLEECGADLVVVGEPFVTVVDERPAREPGCVFRHVSHYVRVEVADGFVDVDHDTRESTLGLQAGWFPLRAAVDANEALRDGRRGEEVVVREDTATDPDALAWIERETHVLERLAAGR
jgi:ADP-ribose pyrophosphatase YjhB (NUDIX family)